MSTPIEYIIAFGMLISAVILLGLVFLVAGMVWLERDR